jgi:hypothetical protein
LQNLIFRHAQDPLRDICYLHGFVERHNGDNATERFVPFLAEEPTPQAERHRRRSPPAGDAANVILTAVGYNLRLVLAWLRMILRVILLALFQTFTIRVALKPAS